MGVVEETGNTSKDYGSMTAHEALIQAGWSVSGLFSCGIHEMSSFSRLSLDQMPGRERGTIYAHADYHANSHTDQSHQDSHSDYPNPHTDSHTDYQHVDNHSDTHSDSP